MTGAQYIQFLFSANGYGANWIGHGDFRWELSDAFTGADKYTGPGILLTVNDVGGFFKKNDFFGDQISEGPKEYPGGDPRSQDLILVHEMAHGVEAAGFQPDLGKDTIEKANNKLVDKYCRQLIERKR